MYAQDKRAAKKDDWRVSEQTLHILSLLGGWPGAMQGQRSFRHKTTKASFQNEYIASVVGNIILLCVLGWYWPQT